MDQSLETRLRYVEDMLAIQQLIACYGPAADSCDTALLERIWAEDSVYDIGGIGICVGHPGLRDIFAGPFHQDLVAHGAAHAATVPHIVIDGDRASATHYGTLFRHRDGKFELARLIASRWILRRAKTGGWEVERRTNRVLDGSPEARALLSQVEVGPDSGK